MDEDLLQEPQTRRERALKHKRPRSRRPDEDEGPGRRRRTQWRKEDRAYRHLAHTWERYT